VTNIISISQLKHISQTFLNDFNKVVIIFIIRPTVNVVHKEVRGGYLGFVAMTITLFRTACNFLQNLQCPLTPGGPIARRRGNGLNWDLLENTL
jgi:hypothetical protein